jgi:hypothetical protein
LNSAASHWSSRSLADAAGLLHRVGVRIAADWLG